MLMGSKWAMWEGRVRREGHCKLKLMQGTPLLAPRQGICPFTVCLVLPQAGL